MPSAGQVGFIGLGAMGGAMAAQLLTGGYSVTGYDIDPAAQGRHARRGGTVAASPAAAADRADILVLMVHDASQVEDVLFGEKGAAPALPEKSTVWMASTVTPAFAIALGPRLAVFGVRLIDGPVSGGMTGAEAGTLTVIASGTADALAAGEGVMKACSGQVFRVGDLGAGSTIKMVNQVLTAAHIALAAEALALGVRAGVDPRVLIDVITRSAGSSRMFEKRAPRMVEGDHVPQSTLNTFLKDLGIALATARGLDFPVPLAEATRRIFSMAADLGHPGDSDTTVLRVYEKSGALDVAAVAR